ncbi:hypothetical protein GmRootA79_53360 (plasmid) [Acidovorax sp. A79]|uniref:hypothetical protein n=1 Tax=Acidovorax sp. A79 TaxID=3056107 RepID=UPI0034E8C23E
MLTTAEFRKNFLGYNIVDCVVRSAGYLYFIAQEDYTQRPGYQPEGHDPDASALIQRVVVWRPDQSGDKRWTHSWNKGMDITIAEFASQPEDKLVAVDVGGEVYAIGSGSKGREGAIPFERKGRYGAVNQLHNIDGHLYLCGGNRTVGVRRGIGQWHWETGRFPLSAHEFGSGNVGFRAIDGFGANDIYAVGDQGDVWHYGGGDWRRIGFPGKQSLRTVCCAGDGKVYISGYEGITFVGRGDEWRCIAEPGLALPFRDLVWHDGKVWATSDYGVWWVSEQGIAQAELPAEISVCAGHLSSRAGILLLAGFHGAALLQDGRWQLVFHHAAMAERSQKEHPGA